jgi:hypothetical protein
MVCMKRRAFFCLALLGACVIFSSPARPFDFPAVEGWEPASEVRVYSPENLWEAIDGAAETFLASGFKELRSRDMKSGEIALTLEIYEMDSPLGAFGIFASERPEKEDWLPIGAGAIVSLPYQCVLLKGSCYVKVAVYEGKVTKEEGEALLEKIAKALPGTDSLPGELKMLPIENMVPHSQGYARQGFLGLPELPHCIWACYTDRYGRDYRFFFILPSPAATAESTWARLSTNWKTLHHGIHSILFRDVPYTGLVGVARTEKGIYGAADSKSELELVRRLEQVLE